MGRIFDCFMPPIDLTILKLRLQELYELVDIFIMIEAKTKFLEENEEELLPYMSKIRIINDRSDLGDELGKHEVEDSDLILMSAENSIPNRKTIIEMRNKDLNDVVYKLEQTTYYYNLYYQGKKTHSGLLMTGKCYKKYNLSYNDFFEIATNMIIADGGWRFSNFGLIEQMIENVYSKNEELNVSHKTSITDQWTYLLCHNIYKFHLVYDTYNLPKNFWILGSVNQLRVLYGIDSDYSYVTDKFKAHYDIGKYYSIGANKNFNHVFGDPAIGKRKKLVIIHGKTVFWIEENDKNYIKYYIRNDQIERNNMVLIQDNARCNIDDHNVIIHYNTETNIQYFTVQAQYQNLIYVKQKDNSDHQHEIYGFYHICTVGKWEEIVNDQVKTILNSGLYDKCQTIYVVIFGVECHKVQLPDKFRIIHRNIDGQMYERPILYYMRQKAMEVPTGTKFWYLHSKGVTKSNTQYWNNVTDWRKMMEYFLITQFDNCLYYLNTHDTYGVNLRTHPKLHYSGNFFWANSQYVKTLPAHIGSGYVDPEMWICSSPGHHYCAFESGVDHYNHPCPFSLYGLLK